MTYSTVFFDLDGTLTDSQQGITETIHQVLTALGHGSVLPKDLVWCVGPPLRDSFVTLLEGSEQLADQAMELYSTFYEGGGMFINRVYPGVVKALDELRQAGYRLNIVTGKPPHQATPILNHFGLRGFFDSVYGPSLVNRNEDKGWLLECALKESGCRAEECVYIGDRGGDVRGALGNGIDMIAVTYGYGSREELVAAGATRFAEAPSSWKGCIRDMECEKKKEC